MTSTSAPPPLELSVGSSASAMSNMLHVADHDDDHDVGDPLLSGRRVSPSSGRDPLLPFARLSGRPNTNLLTRCRRPRHGSDMGNNGQNGHCPPTGLRYVAMLLLVSGALVLLGSAASNTFHQLRTPELAALVQERKELTKEVDELRLQVSNMTSIAESRLEMIHLLEQELEKQALEAAAAEANAQANGARIDGQQNVKPVRNPSNGINRMAMFWPTLVYSGIAALVLVLAIAMRVHHLARMDEELAKSNAAISTRQQYRLDSEPELSATTSSSASGSVMTLVNNDPSATTPPRCYKRAPGSSITGTSLTLDHQMLV